MRIISGIYKNRRINFNHLNIRPTTDFAKESLFNLLNNRYDLTKSCVLDLFAGSGSISYEFVSRGTKKIIAVDYNLKCVDFIKTTKTKLNMGALSVIRSKAKVYLNKNKQKYDIVFADPPYKYPQKKYNELLERILKNETLNNNGSIIIEHSKFIKFDDHQYFDVKKKYGNINFTFFKK